MIDKAQQDTQRREWEKDLSKRESDLQRALNEYNKSKKRKDLAYKDLYADDSTDSYYSEEEMNEISYEEYDPPKAHKTKRKKKTKQKQIDHLPPININMQRYLEDT